MTLSIDYMAKKSSVISMLLDICCFTYCIDYFHKYFIIKRVCYLKLFSNTKLSWLWFKGSGENPWILQRF